MASEGFPVGITKSAICFKNVVSAKETEVCGGEKEEAVKSARGRVRVGVWMEMKRVKNGS